LGYSLLISETDFQGLAQSLENATSRVIDGVVLYAPSLHISDEQLLEISAGIPFVRRDYLPGSKVAWVGFDQVYASQLAIDYLLKMGHHRIAEITPPRHYHNGHWRHQGAVDTLAQHGLALAATVEGDYTIQSGYTGAMALLDSQVDFTAVVAGTDKMALGAIHAFRERGLSVPEDISIIGFDNAEVAAFTYPPMTTVEFKFDKQDEIVVKYLIELINDPEIELHQRILTPSLVIRDSVRQL
jgi:LacI family transcriptional regulator